MSRDVAADGSRRRARVKSSRPVGALVEDAALHRVGMFVRTELSRPRDDLDFPLGRIIGKPEPPKARFGLF